MSLPPALALLVELRARGVELEFVGDRIRYRPVEAVTPELLERLRACKGELLGYQRAIEAEAAELAKKAEAGAGDRPSLERCPSCNEPDFQRPRAGGTWRCARCAPYRELPGTEVDWWPQLGLRVPLEEVIAALEGRATWDPLKRPCWCCGGSSWWRLKATAGRPARPWTCGTCHAPLPPPEAIEWASVAREELAPAAAIQESENKPDARRVPAGDPQTTDEAIMPRINFDDVADAGPLPEGEYLCKLERVDPGKTERGHDMWRLAFSVQDGPHKGRLIHDNLPFTKNALPRVKLLCSSLGVKAEGDVDLSPEMIRDRACRVTVGIEVYDGRRRNKVPFDGFAPAGK